MLETDINAGQEKLSEGTGINLSGPETLSSPSTDRQRATEVLRMISSQLIKLPSRIGVMILDLYRATFGVSLGGQCRFYPSCSTYARRALVKHGLIKGSMMALWRLARCNPFNPGGVDEP